MSFSTQARAIAPTNLRRALAAGTIAAIAGTLAGCSSTNGGLFAKKSPSGDYTTQGLANKATVEINPEEVSSLYNNDYYTQRANQVQLPGRWLGEAMSSTAETEARRAAAQAALVNAEANHNEGLASARASYEAALTSRDNGWTDGFTQETVFTAKIDEMRGQSEAYAHRADAQRTRGNAEVGIATLEWQEQFQTMNADAQRNWESAQAQHQKMLLERAAFQERGEAQIKEMNAVSVATANRAEQRVNQLRTEAQTNSEQSAARVAALTTEIETTTERFNAQAGEFRQLAESVLNESKAKAQSYRAKADALEEQDVDRAYELALMAAAEKLDRAKADADRMIQSAEAHAQSVAAEVERLESEAFARRELSKSSFASQIASVNRFVEQGEADISFRRAQASQIEIEARAEFVAAEAEARANAVRETMAHQRALTSAELELIAAEAESEARRIQAQISRELAAQAQRGSVALPGNNDPTTPGATSGDPLPALAEAPTKPVNLQPKRVAAYKTALAEAAAIRKFEVANESELYATAQERRTKSAAWLAQEVAVADSMLARASTVERKGAADVDDLYMQSETLLSSAEATFDRENALAEASRRETLAQIMNLRAEADLVVAKSASQSEEYLAKAEATLKNGTSQARSLRQQRDAAIVRGEARTKALLAEAESLERSQKAVVAQMQREVETAQLVLAAEVEKLEQVAESFVNIAQATFDEQVFVASTFKTISETKTAELAAANQAQHQIAQAEVSYMDSLANAQGFAAKAAVARTLADADYEFGTFEADDMLNRGRIEAQTRMAQAAAEAQFAIADAQDRAIRSLFESRIAQTQSDRNRAFARAYLEQQQDRAFAVQANAAFAAYADLSNQAMSRLSEQAASFNEAAQDNWDSRLAGRDFPVTKDGWELFLNSTQILNPAEQPSPVEVSDVPTHIDD